MTAAKSGTKKPKAPAGGYTVAVGMNLSHRDEERYEPGDPIDAEHVAPWMVEQGIVEGPPVEPEEGADLSAEGVSSTEDGSESEPAAPGGVSPENDSEEA